MLLAKLLLLPCAVASTVTIYLHPIPDSTISKSSVIPSPVPLASVDYDLETSTGSVTSYTPPHGSYSAEHFLRVGLHDATSNSWKGVVTSAASFADQYKRKFVVHVDEKGEVYHVGFSATAKDNGEETREVEVEVVKRGVGPKPVLNKPVVLNAEGKIDSKEPEKTFLQKYWWAIGLFLLVQVVAGGKE
ncbi:hypothetical protein P280DRAFT_391327 [Massarina eburnea CBS 473.64]|uniref:Cyclin-dependent protein kinase regulator pho80 n=1 Tax=Massarina eburnea CBS 473.64 TaxID=1395130 RepID=A0A6A6SFA3_9PLEO|nr:hypothetical protein P280DRAFT_391327 [Massarina eburnea CBS 473.64]